ncbi:MAG: phosphatidylserine decarboxylase [Anaerolineae bacterium]|nr:phosphatidylserine decarboxylase [Anaerolineae bacterium]
MNEQAFFIRQLLNGAADVGALLPCSRFSGQAMVSELARRHGPANILEVGSGTGAITAEIVKIMEPGDRLTVCDLNADFMDFLRQRFETEPDFAAVRERVSFRVMSVTELDEPEPFDYIISTLPFTRFPLDLTERILAQYRQMLKPTGVLSYIEYAWLRKLKQSFVGYERSASAVLDPILAKHEFRQDTILRNVPPAWVHHLRFTQADSAHAALFAPLKNTNRAKLGRFAFDTDAISFMAGAGVLAWLWQKLAPRSLKPLALVPLAGAGLATIFLRDPRRNVPAPDEMPNAVLAACDGRVLAVENVHDERFFAATGVSDWLRISTFLDITDVHINRAPIAGKVLQVLDEAGGYAVASTAAAEHNVATYTVIEGARGGYCVVAQRVGAVARRIVNRAKPGVLLARGDKFGLIRFGSRTDVYLPAASASALVRPDDYILGGQTEIAQM